MSDWHQELVDRLSMNEIVRLQDALSQALVRRFQKRLALVFTDVAGSTPYFAKFGDEAGRKLQQRHVDLVQRAILEFRGRVVDTAGDGAFLCFPEIDDAVNAMIEVQKSIAVDNDSRAVHERLTVRMGCHWGLVLTDDVLVSGDAVNFCSHIAGSANAGEIRLSRAALQGLNDTTRLRLKCRRLPPVALKGIDQPTELFTLDWHDRAIFPARVRFEDGSILPLPSQDIVRFGRLEELDGLRVNDIVLHVTDPSHKNRVSRWHFELHRGSAGYVLRSVAKAPTEVDGQPVSKGEEAAIRQGTHVRVGGVLTLEFLGEPTAEETEQSTILRDHR